MTIDNVGNRKTKERSRFKTSLTVLNYQFALLWAFTAPTVQRIPVEEAIGVHGINEPLDVSLVGVAIEGASYELVIILGLEYGQGCGCWLPSHCSQGWRNLRSQHCGVLGAVFPALVVFRGHDLGAFAVLGLGRVLVGRSGDTDGRLFRGGHCFGFHFFVGSIRRDDMPA